MIFQDWQHVVPIVISALPQPLSEAPVVDAAKGLPCFLSIWSLSSPEVEVQDIPSSPRCILAKLQDLRHSDSWRKTSQEK